jgi:hypothetical protein
VIPNEVLEQKRKDSKIEFKFVEEIFDEFLGRFCMFLALHIGH